MNPKLRHQGDLSNLGLTRASADSEDATAYGVRAATSLADDVVRRDSTDPTPRTASDAEVVGCGEMGAPQKKFDHSARAQRKVALRQVSRIVCIARTRTERVDGGSARTLIESVAGS